MAEKVKECAGRPKYDRHAICPKRPSWVITAAVFETRYACLHHVHTVMKELLAGTPAALSLSVKPYTGP